MSTVKSSRQEISNILALLVKDKQMRKLGSWTLCLSVFAALWLLNWKLFLATSVGIVLMASSYVVQNSHWQRYCRQWQKFLTGTNRQLLLSVISGAIGAFCTYLAASVWTDAENQWLATGAIVQGFVTLSTLGILGWSVWGQKAVSLETKMEKALVDLSHNNSLKRLIAIRQLTRILKDNRLHPEYYWQAIEYFRLMLSEPQVQIVRSALLESLNTLSGDKALKQRNPVKIPLQLNKLIIKNPQSEKHLI